MTSSTKALGGTFAAAGMADTTGRIRTRDLVARAVDRDTDAEPLRPTPAGLGQCHFQVPRAHRPDEPGFLCNGDELGGRHAAEPWTNPAEQGLEPLCHLLEEVVPGRMRVRVVEGLEAEEVDDDEVAFAGGLGREVRFDERAVGEAGERVELGGVGQLAFGPVEHGVADRSAQDPGQGQVEPGAGRSASGQRLPPGGKARPGARPAGARAELQGLDGIAAPEHLPQRRLAEPEDAIARVVQQRKKPCAAPGRLQAFELGRFAAKRFDRGDVLRGSAKETDHDPCGVPDIGRSAQSIDLAPDLQDRAISRDQVEQRLAGREDARCDGLTGQELVVDDPRMHLPPCPLGLALGLGPDLTSSDMTGPRRAPKLRISSERRCAVRWWQTSLPHSTLSR